MLVLLCPYNKKGINRLKANESNRLLGAIMMDIKLRFPGSPASANVGSFN